MRPDVFPVLLPAFNALKYIYSFFNPLTSLSDCIISDVPVHEASWEPAELCLAQRHFSSRHECSGTQTRTHTDEDCCHSFRFIRVTKCCSFVFCLPLLMSRNHLINLNIGQPLLGGWSSLCHRSGVDSWPWPRMSGEKHQPPSCCRSPLDNTFSLASVFPRFPLFRKRIQIKARWHRLNISNGCQGNLSAAFQLICKNLTKYGRSRQLMNVFWSHCLKVIQRDFSVCVFIVLRCNGSLHEGHRHKRDWRETLQKGLIY